MTVSSGEVFMRVGLHQALDGEFFPATDKQRQSRRLAPLIFEILERGENLRHVSGRPSVVTRTRAFALEPTWGMGTEATAVCCSTPGSVPQLVNVGLRFRNEYLVISDHNLTSRYASISFIPFAGNPEPPAGFVGTFSGIPCVDLASTVRLNESTLGMPIDTAEHVAHARMVITKSAELFFEKVAELSS